MKPTTYKVHFAKIWLAFRIKLANWGLGIAIDFDDTIWFTLRLGPLHFDVAYGEQPGW